MNKKKYIAPMMESSALNIDCDVLTMSASKDLPGTKPGDPEDEEEGLQDVAH